MNAVRLILIDGLTGAGKSTTAQRLWLHLERHGHAARWFYEHDTTHPIWRPGEQRRMAETGRLDPGLLETVLPARWRALADECSGGGVVTILESTFFQSTAGFLICMNVPDEEIIAHLLEVDRVLAGSSPVLIYFRHEDVERRLRAVFEDRRADNFEADLIRYIGMTPYGKAAGLCDFAGLARFLEHWCQLVETLLARVGMAKLVVDGNSGDWASRERRITDFLGLPEIQEVSAEVDEPARFTGRYRDEASRDELIIAGGERSLYLGAARRTRLIPKRDATFHVEAMSIEMSFGDECGGLFRRFEIKSPLPGPRSVWLRVDDGGQ